MDGLTWVAGASWAGPWWCASKNGCPRAGLGAPVFEDSHEEGSCRWAQVPRGQLGAARRCPCLGRLPWCLGRLTEQTPNPARDWTGSCSHQASSSSALRPLSFSPLLASPPLLRPRCLDKQAARTGTQGTGPHLAPCGLRPAPARLDQYQFIVQRRGCLPVNEFPLSSLALMNPLKRI